MSEDRLDRLERIVETGFSDIFTSLTFLKERQERLQTQQESSQRQIDNLVESQRQIIENQRAMMDSIERLANVQAETSERLASLGAAVERLDAILDYLIRRDAER